MLTVNKKKITQYNKSKIKAKKNFLMNGFHIEEKIFSNIECANAIESSKKLDQYKRKKFMPEMMPHKKNKNFFSLMKKKSLLKIAKYFTYPSKEKIFAIQSTFFFGVPGTSGSSIHQDSYYVDPENPDSFISAWIPLTDINTKDMGNLVVYEKSHKCGKFEMIDDNYRKINFQNTNLVRKKSKIKNLKNFKKTLILAKQGSVVFMHSNLLHSSIDNNSHKNRYVLLVTYIKDKCKFRAGFEAKRRKIRVQ
jgi:ectoine hydroxylase-related dioxygenase (phytanoyl-CoA dioxygenase family)